MNPGRPWFPTGEWRGRIEDTAAPVPLDLVRNRLLRLIPSTVYAAVEDVIGALEVSVHARVAPLLTEQQARDDLLQGILTVLRGDKTEKPGRQLTAMRDPSKTDGLWHHQGLHALLIAVQDRTTLNGSLRVAVSDRMETGGNPCGKS